MFTSEPVERSCRSSGNAVTIVAATVAAAAAVTSDVWLLLLCLFLLLLLLLLPLLLQAAAAATVTSCSMTFSCVQANRVSNDALLVVLSSPERDTLLAHAACAVSAVGLDD